MYFQTVRSLCLVSDSTYMQIEAMFPENNLFNFWALFLDMYHIFTDLIEQEWLETVKYSGAC